MWWKIIHDNIHKEDEFLTPGRGVAETLKLETC